MIYGDNDILVYYVYSNSGCECVMIFFGKIGCLWDIRFWG